MLLLLMVPGVESAAAARVQASFWSLQSSQSTAFLPAHTLYLFGGGWDVCYGVVEVQRKSAAFGRRRRCHSFAPEIAEMEAVPVVGHALLVMSGLHRGHCVVSQDFHQMRSTKRTLACFLAMLSFPPPPSPPHPFIIIHD